MDAKVRGIVFLLVVLVLCGTFATMQCDQDSLDKQTGCASGYHTICMKGGGASVEDIVAGALSLRSQSKSLQEKLKLMT
jgi:hypothetical protein